MANPSFRAAFRYLDKATTHWFPGHMAKGLREMQKRVDKCDCILEVHDARLPYTGRNPKFDRLASKPRILVLNKADVADRRQEEVVRSSLQELHPNTTVLHMSAEAKVRRAVNRTLDAVLDVVDDSVLMQEDSRLRLLVAGMPNVGKSSLINALRQTYVNRAKCATTGPSPGVTRAVQTSIRIFDDPAIYVIDTPGIMIPNLEHPDDAMKLAAVGILKDDLVGEEYIADYILFMLNQMGHFRYADVYRMSEPSDDIDTVLEAVAKRTGALGKGGVPNMNLSAVRFIRAFRTGMLGYFVLDDYKREPLLTALRIMQQDA